MRQGGPLSLMLFLLAMEPLHLLFRKAHEVHLLQKLRPNCDTCKVSLYVDDATLFIRPNEQELHVVDTILQIFSDTFGLVTNMAKTHFYPIRCHGLNFDLLHQASRVVATFPCSYLGFPLNNKKPSKLELLPMIQKIINRMLGWKRRFFTLPGR
jgi:hypothetical protein